MLERLPSIPTTVVTVGSFYSRVSQTFLANGFVIQHLRREMDLDDAFMISTMVIVLIPTARKFTKSSTL